MHDTMNESMRQTSVYEMSNTARRARKWKVAASAIVLLANVVALPLFLHMMITTPADKLPLGEMTPGITGGFAVLIFFSAAYILTAIRTPVRVKLLPGGIQLHCAHANREIPYADIASTTCLDDANPQEQARVALVLTGVNGKKLAKISSQMERFDELKEDLRRRIAAASGRVPETPEDDRKARLAQRAWQRRFILWGSAAMLVFGAAGMVFLGYEQLHLFRLAREGVEARGVVLRHYVHNNIAHRIEYAFVAPDGVSRSRNTMLPEERWLAHGALQPVTVVYLPGNPGFSRLADEPEESHLLALCAAAFMILTTGAMFALAKSGYDLEIVDGKIMLLRPGELREDRMAADAAVNRKALTDRFSQ